MSRIYHHRPDNKRPFFYLFLFFATGIVFSKYLIPQPFLWQYVLIAVIAVSAGAFLFHNRRLVGFLSAVFALLLGITITGIALVHFDYLEKTAELIDLPKSTSFQVVLLDDPFPAGPVYSRNAESADRITVFALLENIEVYGQRLEMNIPVQLRLVIGADADFRYGDRLKCFGTIRKPLQPRNPNTFNNARWLAQKGIFIEGIVENHKDISLIQKNCGNAFRRGLWSVRRNLRRSLLAGKISNRDRAFLIGMTIGEKYLLSQDLEEVLLNTNTIHILVVSGLNVTILAGAVFLFLRLLPLHRGLRIFIAVIAVFFYVALLDFPAPALRAAIMSSAFLLAPVFKRENDLLNTLSFSAFVSLLFRPLDLFTASFQLSMLIVFSLIMLAAPLFQYFVEKFNLSPDRGFLVYGGARRASLSALRYIVALITSSFAAFIGSLPLVAWYFNLINPLSVLLNSIIVPLAAIITPLGILSAVIGLFSTSLASFLNYINVFFIKIMTGIIEFFSQASFSVIHIRAPILLHAIGFYFLLLLVGFSPSFSRLLRGILIFLFSVSIILILFGNLIPLSLSPELVVFDMEKSGSACILYPDGYVALINTGSEKDARRIIHPFLKSHGINRISIVVLTSMDKNHSGGKDFIAERYRIDNVFINDSSSLRNTVLRSYYTRNNIKAINIENDKSIAPEGSKSLELYGISTNENSQEDSSSIAVRFVYSGSEALLFHGIDSMSLYKLIQKSPSSERLALISDIKSVSAVRSAIARGMKKPEFIIICRDDEYKYDEKNPDKNEKPVMLSIADRGAVIIEFLKNSFEVRTMLP